MLSSLHCVYCVLLYDLQQVASGLRYRDIDLGGLRMFFFFLVYACLVGAFSPKL